MKFTQHIKPSTITCISLLFNSLYPKIDKFEQKTDLQQTTVNHPFSNPMIILIGPMGSGKSTVGENLAQMLHLDFVDIDQTVEENAGCSIKTIFEMEGEDNFRKRETEALESVCCLSNTVVATGGGAIMSEKNRRMMRNGIVIYLHATPFQQYKRIRHRKHRPKFDAERPLAGLTELMETREPLYRAEADLIVNVDNQSVHSITHTIKEYLLTQ